MANTNHPQIGHHHMGGNRGSMSVVAVVSLDQDPEQYRRTFDAATTIAQLRAAINAIESGDGTTAVQACGAAWFRLSMFHHE